MMAKELKYWDHQQIRAFVKDVKKTVGDGWKWMVEPVKVALIAQKAFSVIRMQAREEVAIEAMDELYCAMLEEAGLEEC